MKTQRKILQLSYAILFLLALFVFSCKKEKPVVPETKNPCECAREVTADFTMEELSNPFTTGEYTETDTIFKEKNVRFNALEDNAEYTWYIGVEELTTKEVSRYFDQTLSGSNLPITLVVNKEPNKFCFPDDDGYDSITKTIHVSPLPSESGQDVNFGSIEGVYRMKSEHLPDSFDIDFSVIIGQSNGYMFNILNYDGQGSNCENQAEISDRNYRQVWTNNGTSVSQCEYLRGYVHNRIDGIAEMEFSTRVYEGNNLIEYKWHYLGRKL